jgi:phosphatidate cytidylyltransferase
MFIIFIPIYVFLLLPARMIITGDTQGFLRAIGTLQWGIVITVFFLSHAASLLVMPIADDPRVLPVWQSEVSKQWPGPGLFLLLLLLTQGNDVAQYIWGKSLGKRKLSPTVSPGKTWGGFLGGLVTTVIIAGLVGPSITMMSPLYAVAAGALVAVSGIIGDLNISALKRDLGVKDSGTTLPGHGGILDRVDSLTFTAPVFFHFVWYCYG